MRGLITACVLALGACSEGAPAPGIDVDGALAFVRSFATAPRPEGSPAARAAVSTIEAELSASGIPFVAEPVGQVELPPIVVLGQTYRRARRATVSDPNIVVSFGPQGPALVVMAHYDSVDTSPGAIDNAAAVAVLLGVARELHAHPPPQRVMLVFTAAEEIGLVGAEAFAARHATDVAFSIALDLIGGDGDLSINGASVLIGNAELSWLAAAADRAGVTLDAPPAHRVVSRWWPQAERSDHGAFTRRGGRAIHLYNRGSDGEWIDLAYHSARDVPDRVHRRSVDDLGRLLLVLAATPAPAHDGDGYWVPLATNTVVPRGFLLIVELALLLVALVSLVLSRDGLVATLGQHRRVAPGPALLVGAACYVAALAACVGVERMVSGAHPAPWLHAPVRSLFAYGCIMLGALGLITRAVARFWPWRGEYRYLALAIIVLATVGTTMLVLGAAELAWVWLVPAAMLALAPRLGRAAPLVIVSSLLPVWAVLHPDQLREAAWNGFFPLSLPFVLWVGVLGIPVAAAAGFALRRRGTAGPLGTLILGVGCGLLVLVGLVVAVTSEPRCSAMKFKEFHLACERV